MKEPKYVAETLAWCNRLRDEKGQPPLERLPQGKRADARSCPCGIAADVHVDTHSFRMLRAHIRHPLPRAVQRFVAAFDSGRFPQYEAKP